MKICNSCEHLLPDDEFQRRDKRFFRKKCRSCESNLRLKRAVGVKSPQAKINKAKYLRERATKRRRDPKYRAETILIDCRNNDRQTNRDNDLSIEFVRERIASGCSYCGEMNPKMASLDRVDNKVGHIRSNVVAACQRCNLIRGDIPFDAWLLIVPGVRVAVAAGAFGDWYQKRLEARVFRNRINCLVEEGDGVEPLTFRSPRFSKPFEEPASAPS
jgi:aspartate carbamoyltransferase regulatory subunit